MTEHPENKDEDWDAVVSHLPEGWEDSARRHGALTRLRGFASAEQLLRTLLIHLAQGCSLRETALRAQRGGIASVSDVAILKRLRASEAWLLDLCRGMRVASRDDAAALASKGRRLVAVDATCVSEPGSTGTDWRLHYALDLASMNCLHFELTDAHGAELFTRFSFEPGDLVLADRAYCRVAGIQSVLERKADVLVRFKLSQTNVHLEGESGRFDFLAAARPLAENETAQWDVRLGERPELAVPGRLCILRRPEEVAAMDRERILREARKKKRQNQPRTLEAASFVGLFCTAPRAFATPEDLFKAYRLRWQIELAFKRLKSLTEFGFLPKRDPCSCRAWLYGKLLVGLLVEKMAGTPFFP